MEPNSSPLSYLEHLMSAKGVICSSVILLPLNSVIGVAKWMLIWLFKVNYLIVSIHLALFLI